MSGWFSAGEDDKNELCPTLTFQQRIYGFIGCLLLGFMLSILSWISAFKRNWEMFGLFFTMGNIVAMSSSLFFAGPVKQFKRMFEETRWIATSVYVVAMILTVVVAVYLKSAPLVLVMCLIQYLAMIWYGLSYIPYARTLLKTCFKSVV